MADRYSYNCRSNIHSEISHTPSNLSFSSTLLEEICRSIDRGGDEIATCRESMRKKRDDATARFLFKTEEEMANYQRACMIEKWMEKKVVGRGKSSVAPQEKMSGKDRQYSSSSSSDSSSGGDGGIRAGGFFSSSEAESFPFRQPKPVRTGILGFEKEKGKICVDDSGINRRNRRGFSDGLEQKPKIESRFVRTKSKALKIYGDLKKVKQPISPGGKVAAFLNSLFAAGNLKKTKIAAACGDDSPSLKSTATTCSSASSFTRSCLSKATTSTLAKSAGSAKRSVRFFPVSVIVDEDCQPCGHKSLHQNNNDDGEVDLIDAAIDNKELAMHSFDAAIDDAAMHVRKEDQMGSTEFEHSFDIFSRIRDRNRSFDQDFDDEFDGASCASSDLFELENLSAIGILEELPVYETTHLEKIQTVANGLIL